MLNDAGIGLSTVIIDSKLRKNGITIDHTVYGKFELRDRVAIRNRITHEAYDWKDWSGKPSGSFCCYCSPMAGKTIDKENGEFALVSGAMVALLYRLDPSQKFEVTSTFHEGFPAARSAGIDDPGAVGHMTLHCSHKAYQALYSLMLSPESGPMNTPVGLKYFGYSLECLKGKVKWYGAMVSSTPDLIFKSLLEGGEKSRTAVTILSSLAGMVPLKIKTNVRRWLWLWLWLQLKLWLWLWLRL